MATAFFLDFLTAAKDQERRLGLLIPAPFILVLAVALFIQGIALAHQKT